MGLGLFVYLLLGFRYLICLARVVLYLMHVFIYSLVYSKYNLELSVFAFMVWGLHWRI